jgi:hypothetical protein
VASAWITTRATAGGGKRYRVMYRLSGRESLPRYAGSFRTRREALTRRAWLIDELAAMRVPDCRHADHAVTASLKQVAERGQASRVDVAAGTLQTYRVALGRILPRFGTTSVDGVDAQAVAAFVADLHADGLKKQTIRKTVSVLAMVLDHARVQPNPARDRLTSSCPERNVGICNHRRRSMSRRSSICCRAVTAFPCSLSTPRACAWANWRHSPGETSTSLAPGGEWRRVRPAGLGG